VFLVDSVIEINHHAEIYSNCMYGNKPYSKMNRRII